MLKWVAVFASVALLAACAEKGSSGSGYKRTRSHSSGIMRPGGGY